VTPLDAFLSDACLHYDGHDSPERRARAADALAQTPAIADELFAACVLGRSRAVADILASSPDRARVAGGPQGWPPLLYLTYGRIDGRRDGETYLAAARALLDAGADPDAHFLDGGTYRFTALTGCWGEGEQGPEAQPEHVEGPALAAELLARGADPNDGQALYNRMFTPGSACLDALLAAGLRPDHRLNWSDPDGRPQTRTTMGYQLHHAAVRGYADRVERLVAAGARLDEPDERGLLVHAAAFLAGRIEIAERLRQAGAPVVPLDDADRLTSALRRGDLEEARDLVDAAPELFVRAEARHGDLLVDVAGRGDVDGIDLLLALGVDPNREAPTPAVHQAALTGQVDALRRLLERGADPERLDGRFGATALGWARHAEQSEAVAILEAWRQERPGAGE